MAGIGFELKRIYEKKTLASNIYGTFYATMTTVGPTVITTALMLVLSVLLHKFTTVLESRFFISSVSSAFLSAILIAALITSPISRYIADCVFLDKNMEICASMFGTLSLSSILSGIVMGIWSFFLYKSSTKIPMYFIVLYYLLGVLVTGVYSVMTYSSALKQYKTLTFGFLTGLITGLIAFFISYKITNESVIAAYIGLVSAYVIILFLLVFQNIRAFGNPNKDYFKFFEYLKRYPILSVGNFLYILGFYQSILIYWFTTNISETISIFHSVPPYDASVFLAILVNIPAMVIFVVKIETAFYEEYKKYVSALNNGTLKQIEKEHSSLMRKIKEKLLFVYETQLIITIVLSSLTVLILPYLDTSLYTLSMFLPLSFGIYAVFCMYFNIVIFYYFSDYKSACISSAVFFVVTTIFSIISAIIETLYPMPLLIGGVVGLTVSLVLLNRRMENLTPFLLCNNN